LFNGGDIWDRVHVGLSGLYVPSQYRHYWEGKPISGIFSPDTKVKGAIPAFYTKNVPTRYRASGASASYQIAQVYGGGLIRIVAGLILRTFGIHKVYIYIS
jgi:hypothetical protein